MLPAVRKAALPAIFSQGVRLAREGGVVVVARSDEAEFGVIDAQAATFGVG